MFPGGASGKGPTCQGMRHKRHGFHPWVRKIPLRRAWQPTPVFFSVESHGQRSLAGNRLSMHVNIRKIDDILFNFFLVLSTLKNLKYIYHAEAFLFYSHFKLRTFSPIVDIQKQ